MTTTHTIPKGTNILHSGHRGYGQKRFTISVYLINSSPHKKHSGNLNIIWLLRLDNVAAICIVLVDEVYCEFVGGHHDGRVGDLPDEVGGEAPVKSRPALLLVNQTHSLPK